MPCHTLYGKYMTLSIIPLQMLKFNFILITCTKLVSETIQLHAKFGKTNMLVIFAMSHGNRESLFRSLG